MLCVIVVQISRVGMPGAGLQGESEAGGKRARGEAAITDEGAADAVWEGGRSTARDTRRGFAADDEEALEDETPGEPIEPPDEREGSEPAGNEREAIRNGAAVETARTEWRGAGDDQGTAATQPTTREKPDRSVEGRRERVKRFGGNELTEDSVESGLAWLAAHQSADGTWSRTEFNRGCPATDRCTGEAELRTEYALDAGLTGLATLAFLGAGYTHAVGPYRQTVDRAIGALMSMQTERGGFSEDETLAGYNDSVATLALAEHYALTRDRRVAEPLRRAVERLSSMQQALGGWDYGASGTSGRNDTSITAWVVQALNAAKWAGISPAEETLVGAAMHVARASQADGKVWYADAGIGFELDAAQRPRYRYGPAMTACGLVCETLLGWRMDSATILAQRAHLFSNAPSTKLARGGDATQLHSEYYWYYGTLAMFQVGGESWERWNARLRDVILPLQNREKMRDGRRKHAFGSWTPYGGRWGRWGRMGGRVYTTAICTLTLEIYYRGTPAYLQPQSAITAEDWRAFVGRSDARGRMRAMEALREARHEIGEPVLVELLGDEDAAVRLAAAGALSELDSPMGRKVLDELLTKLPPWERGPAERALARITRMERTPRPEGVVRLYDRQVKLATLDLSRAYVGQRIVVERAGSAIARMVVVQRFSGRTLAVAALAGEIGTGTAPAEGDMVRAE